MTDPQRELLAALEAAGLPIQSITPEERAMFATLSDEEVTRLIELRRRSNSTDSNSTDSSVGSREPADSRVADSEVSAPTDPGG